jgi:hypothetical protein
MRLIVPTLLVVFGVVCRVVPHPWNFAPIGAVALFAGATFKDRRAAVAVPLVAMFIGDVFVGFHSLMPVLYGAYALIAVLGTRLRDHRGSPLHVAGGATAGATIFFVLSNFAVWVEMYPRTWAGLVACYAAAIPFFERTLVSDWLYAAIFFGLHALAERSHAHRVPAA